MTLEDYLLTFYVQTALLAIIALVSFIRLSKRNKATKLIGLLFSVGFLCNVTAQCFIELGFSIAIINLPSALYDFALVLILGMLYDDQTRYNYSKIFISLTILFLAIGIVNLIFIQQTLASFNKLVSSFIIIGYTTFYFYRLMVELPTSQVQRLPMFWFNSGLLIYHAGTIFLFAFMSYLINVMKDNMIVYWSIHNILSIIGQLLILIGLLYDLKGQPSPTHHNRIV